MPDLLSPTSFYTLQPLSLSLSLCLRHFVGHLVLEQTGSLDWPKMALEAVFFSQDQLLSSSFKDDFYSLGGVSSFDFGSEVSDAFDKPLCFGASGTFYTSPIQNHAVNDLEYHNSKSPEACTADQYFSGEAHHPAEGGALATAATTAGRRKRQRRSRKNKEEIENQRMIHIAVERNRRKQMNEYLAITRSLLPPPYAQKGDQASIIGGAINYVKELEQQLQSLEAQKKKQQQQNHNTVTVESSSVVLPFADFFAFPRHSTRSNQGNQINSDSVSQIKDDSAPAQVEVTMVESHASLKMLTKKQPTQLSKLVAAFQSFRLSVLHLNVTAVDQTLVLYTFSLKQVEEGSQLNSTDEIAAAANHILRKIQEETRSSIIQ
ncbi:hypothetical protein Ancab_038375 [Ancistrocladus abbreviatus]